MIHEAAEEVLSDPRVQAERGRVMASEQRATGARAGLASDSIIPQVAIGPGPGYLGSALALREANRPVGFRQPHVFLGTPFANWLVNEQQAVRGTGGVRVGAGRIPGTGQRRVNYDALIAELELFKARTNPRMTDQVFGSHLTQFVATGRAGGPFASTEGAAFMADFSRIALSVEPSRSTSFAVEGPMLISLVQRGESSVEDAFSRQSKVNPLSMVGAAGANRLYETRVQGLPDPRRPSRRIEAGYEEVVRRLVCVTDPYVEAEMRARNLTFENNAEFMRWAREELRPLIVERARQLFALTAANTSEFAGAPLLFGGRQTVGLS